MTSFPLCSWGFRSSSAWSSPFSWFRVPFNKPCSGTHLALQQPLPHRYRVMGATERATSIRSRHCWAHEPARKRKETRATGDTRYIKHFLQVAADYEWAAEKETVSQDAVMKLSEGMTWKKPGKDQKQNSCKEYSATKEASNPTWAAQSAKRQPLVALGRPRPL